MTLYETIVAKQIFDKRILHRLVFLVETKEDKRSYREHDRVYSNDMSRDERLTCLLRSYDISLRVSFKVKLSTG